MAFSSRSRRSAVRPHARAWIETASLTSKLRGFFVRPHARAWIETPDDSKYQPWYKVFALTRGRGLKRRRRARDKLADVRPHARAWIETEELAEWFSLPVVRPHARAWIETADLN